MRMVSIVRHCGLFWTEVVSFEMSLTLFLFFSRRARFCRGCLDMPGSHEAEGEAGHQESDPDAEEASVCPALSGGQSD
jgi:hypothetical protein